MLNLRRRRAVRVASAVLVVVLFLFLGACAKNPVTGEDQLVFMSESRELALGNAYYPQVIQLNWGTPPEDHQLQNYVSDVGWNLADVSHRPNLPWRFTVVNSSQINAFALPGGKVCITRGLITKMSSEDELAGVLGHEIGHVTARHAVSSFTRRVILAGALLGLSLALTGTDYGTAALAGAGLTGGLMMLGYSRDQERQADELGYAYMTKAGYNPKAMVKTFELFLSLRNSEPSLIQGWLSTHPPPHERIAAARKRARSSPAGERSIKTEMFQRSLARQKSLARAYVAMDQGDALAKKRQWSQVAEQYRKAISLYPKEGMFYTRLGMAQMEQGEEAPALASAEQGARLSNGTYYPNLILGIVATANRKYSLAVDAHRKAAEILPGQVINNFLLAKAHDKIGPRSSAVLYYRKVVKASPTSDYGKEAAKRLDKLGYR